MNGIGQSPLGPVEGTWVIVFFKDGDECQQPVMMGTIGGIPIEYTTEEQYDNVTGIAVDKIKSSDESVTPTYTAPDDNNGFKDPAGIYPRDAFLEEPDTNRLARGQKLKHTSLARRIMARRKGVKIGNSTATWDQPQIPYFAKYPYNHVTETESGHVVEYDDTPMAERTCHMHATGTFTEVDASGTQVNRILGNGYTIIDKDGFVQIAGTCIISVDGDASINVGGALHLDVANKMFVDLNNTDLEFKCKSFKIDCHDFNLTAAEKVSVQAVADVSVKTDAAIQLKAAANIHGDGAQIHWNSGKAVPSIPLPVKISYTPMLYANPSDLVPHTDVDVSALTMNDILPPRKLDLMKMATK